MFLVLFGCEKESITTLSQDDYQGTKTFSLNSSSLSKFVDLGFILKSRVKDESSITDEKLLTVAAAENIDLVEIEQQILLIMKEMKAE